MKLNLLSALSEHRRYFLLSAVILLADQASKIAAHAMLRGQRPLTVIPGVFNLIYSRNRGGLFGFFGTWDDPWRTILLTAMPLLAVVLIGLFIANTEKREHKTRIGLCLILGGAVGNLVDRAFRGEVVDFLDVYVSHQGMAEWLIARFNTAHWPTFNIADSAIVVGACLLILDVFTPAPKKAAPE